MFYLGRTFQCLLSLVNRGYCNLDGEINKEGIVLWVKMSV